jgi:Plasmid encoded RepA protein
MTKSRKKSLDQIIAEGPSQDEILNEQMDADSDPSYKPSSAYLARLKKQIDALNKQYEELLKPPHTQTDKKKAAPRDHKLESHLAKSRRASSLAAVRIERDAAGGDEEIFQVAQALILCGLPYEKSDQIRITRTARVADGSVVSVTFTVASKGGEMPYGSDRTLLHFLFNKAVRSNSRFISWETATEFLKAMEIGDSGKNYRDLRARFDRIRGLVISVERKTSASTLTDTSPIIRRSHLPTSVDVHAAQQGQSLLPIDSTSIVFGVELDEAFFEDLKRYHVPVPAAIIKTTRNKSQLQDIMLFLHWRCYAAKKTSLIEWDHLRLQLWQDDSNERRIKSRFAEAILALRVLWPELQAEAQKTGLIVGPPKHGRYLLPHGAQARLLDQ